MKSVWKHVLVPLALVLTASCGALAQTTTSGFGVNPDGINFNHGPCDFSDAFYTANGISVANLDLAPAQRFGNFRQFGPPATGAQKNWVTDTTCSTNDPDRRNVRILATTGGYTDDGTFNANQFISIMAFLTNQNLFTGVANARNIQMADIISNFEAYAALKQRLPDGTFALTPCGSMGTGATPCFPVTSVATPALRQDWRFATNRNAIDGSDNNAPVLDANGNPVPQTDANGNPIPGTIQGASPFGYFCDDLLGAWIITYFWFTVDPANPGPVCGPILKNLTQLHGNSLDGTPIIITADELNNQLEANGCGAEGQEASDGSDGGAIWIICPGLLDPRNGAITKDAFLDHVTFPNGQSVDPRFLQNFNCLQTAGQFPGSLNDGSQPTGTCKPGSGSL
jgi:hypothetical protein